jgi:Amt family ammonium transporter
MVAVSGSVDRIENWGAVLIGAISSLWYIIIVQLLDFFRIDDPLESIPVHFGGGIWGLFATGFFDTVQGALFYGSQKQGLFMGYQLVGIAVIIFFTTAVVLPAFVIMSKLEILRADKAIEEIGFDVADINPGVSDEFINAVREKIDAMEAQEKKRK